jgi:5'-nucleotidase/UDP-sugar diphosphatase
MRTFLQGLVVSAILVAGAAGILLAQDTTITLLHINDTHSHLEATGPKDANLNGTLGGIAKAATVIGSARAAESNVLFLHAGDFFQGDPFFNKYFGVPELRILKQLGVDAMAVGNHEFDYGPGALSDALSAAFAGGSFPLVSANLDLSAFPSLMKWIQPSILKTIAGVKIGIFGMTVPNNPQYRPAPVIVRDSVAAIAEQAVKSLRNAGAEVVVFLSHLGIFYDRMVAKECSWY